MTGHLGDRVGVLGGVHRRRAAVVLLIGLIGGGVALLLWARLRLVTDIPRTAYAEPEQEAAQDSGPRGGAARGGMEPRARAAAGASAR